MGRGRPRKATALKLLDGNPGKRALPKEREVDQSPGVKPKWLSAEASAVWDELAPDRIAIGLLTNLTAESFGQLCAYLATFRQSPLLLTGPQVSDMRAKQNAFGFDPSALAKLGIGARKKGPTNPFAELTG